MDLNNVMNTNTPVDTITSTGIELFWKTMYQYRSGIGKNDTSRTVVFTQGRFPVLSTNKQEIVSDMKDLELQEQWRHHRKQGPPSHS